MKNVTTYLLAALLLLIFNISGFAQSSAIPRTISYQGYVTDAAKKSLSGMHTISLKLYDGPLSTTALHNETFVTQVSGGVFSVVLGSTQSFDPTLGFDKQYWLGVSIDGAEELSPRTALTSVPYAIQAASASSLTKNASGAIRSINGRSGDLQIKAGEGTSIQSVGNTITISATPNVVMQPQGNGNVSSVTGTINQITASPTSGNVILTLPQDIHPAATPTFSGLTLSGMTTGILHSAVAGGLSSSLITNADISATASIADTKLGTITTTGKVSNTATSATALNMANTIVLRDASGNFTAGSITAASMTVSGKASSAVTLSTDPTNCLTTKGYVDNATTNVWNLNGNTGTSASNYIGTADASALSFRTNAVERMKITDDGSLLLSGASGAIPISGSGTRLMWVPSLGAFRAGRTSGSEWNAGNIGAQSAAMGYGTIASGDQSFAAGLFTNAFGIGSTSFGSGSAAYSDGSTAIGSAAQAVGFNSVAMGDNTTAWGDGSLALGSNTSASGVYSSAFGFNTTTMNDYATVMGKNLTIGASSFGFNGTSTNTVTNISAMHNVAYFGDVDVLIGNADNTARSLKFYSKNSSATYSGAHFTAFKAGIQTADLTYTLPTAQGSSGSVLSNNGSGTLSWAKTKTAYATVSAGAAIAIPANTTVVKITEDADDTQTNPVTMPTGANGDIMYIYNGDTQDTTGDVVVATGTTGIFVYVDGWKKAN
jgi:hypothetical protein